MKIQLPDHAKLRIYRLQRKMQMQHLARYLGISLSYYSHMERGSRPIPEIIVEELDLDRSTRWLVDMLESIHSPIYIRELLKCLKLGDDYVTESN